MGAPYDLVILDFDGTFTDAEAEAGPFFTAYRERAASMLAEHGLRDFDGAWDAALAQVEAEPGAHGWSWDGRVVAPGDADPYLRATVVMNVLFDARGLYADGEARKGVLQVLYETSYPKSATVFRPDARAVAEALLSSGMHVAVVTNSATDAVNAKLDALAPRGRERLRVHGNAEKYVVVEPSPADATFAAVPEAARAPGLARPIFLRRGRYYEVLRRLWDELGTTAERTFVAGDIYELDLALPAALGASVQLVGKERTPAFERAAVADLPRGRVDDRLGALLERVGL
ncbi:MAG: HAD family hydrolase [Myxococcota bacterium]